MSTAPPSRCEILTTLKECLTTTPEFNLQSFPKQIKPRWMMLIAGTNEVPLVAEQAAQIPRTLYVLSVQCKAFKSYISLSFSFSVS